MLRTRLQIFFIAIFALLLLAFALPEFSVNVAGRTFRYPSIGFSKVGVPADFPSFPQGKDVFSSSRIILNITNQAEEPVSAGDIETLASTIRKRAEYASLYDIEIHGRLNGNVAQLVVDIPKNYSDSVQYAKLLTTPGKISFSYLQIGEDEQVSIIPIDIADNNIIRTQVSNNIKYKTQAQDSRTGETVDQSNSTSGLHLKMQIDPSKSSELFAIPPFLTYANTVLSGQMYGVTMEIDNSLIFEIVRDEYSNDIVFALPTRIATDTERSHAIRLTQSILREEAPLNFLLEVDENSGDIAPKFNESGGSFISGMFILGMILVTIYLAKETTSKVAFSTMLSVSIHLLFLLNLLKIFQVPISYSFITGIVLSALLLILIALSVFNDKVTEIDQKFSNIVRVFLISTLSFLILWRININLHGENDLLIILTVLSLTGAVLVPIIYKPIYNIFIHKDTSILHILGLRKA